MNEPPDAKTVVPGQMVSYHNSPSTKTATFQEPKPAQVVLDIRIEMTGQTWEVTGRGTVHGAKLVRCEPAMGADYLVGLLMQCEIYGQRVIGVERHPLLGTREGESLGLLVRRKKVAK